MKITTYVYVITQRYPKSGTPWLNENQPQMVCGTEADAKRIVAELEQLSKSGEPILFSAVRVPFVEVPK